MTGPSTPAAVVCPPSTPAMATTATEKSHSPRSPGDRANHSFFTHIRSFNAARKNSARMTYLLRPNDTPANAFTICYPVAAAYCLYTIL